MARLAVRRIGSRSGVACRSLTVAALSAPLVARTPMRSAALLAILLVAGGLRLGALADAPAGLNQDEAASAWNAWALLHTGRDQHGQPWPVFYMRAFGANRSTLYAWLLIPFQALGGLNIWTTRLPNALGGVFTVWLAYWIGRRLFDRDAGLCAAGLLAITPWSLQLSRWGHEGCLTPLLCALPLASWLWAGLPPTVGGQRQHKLSCDDESRDDQSRRDQSRDRKGAVSAGRAVLTGLATGLCCYGYPAARIFIPAMLLAYVAATWPAWASRRRGLWWPLAVFALAFAATFGPLAWQHVFNAEAIGRRAAGIWVWSADQPLAARVGSVLARYPGHFGHDFLFGDGDHYETAWASGHGVLYGFMAPLLIVGAGCVFSNARRDAGARVLLAWLLVYPVGDCLTQHVSMHAMRSAAGVVPLALLAGLGLAGAGRWLRRQAPRGVALTVGVVLGWLVIAQTGAFLWRLFVTRNHEQAVFQSQHVDFVEACHWLRGRLDEYDAVAFTVTETTLVYSVTLVALEYDARRFGAEPREYGPGPWERCLRYGHVYFLERGVRERLLRELGSNARGDRLLLFLRPQDEPLGTLVREFHDFAGNVTLRAMEARL